VGQRPVRGGGKSMRLSGSGSAGPQACVACVSTVCVDGNREQHGTRPSESSGGAKQGQREYFYCLHLKMPQRLVANNLIVRVLQLINFISVFPHGSFSGNAAIFAYLCHSDKAYTILAC